MIEHVLESEQWIDRPLDEVFAFFSDASNLERITPNELKFSILSPQPIDMKVGALIDYRLRLAGVPFTWRTEITAWNPPHSFEDTQLKGPYAQWIHTHTFREEDGRTLITDRVRWKLPLSPLGDLVYPVVNWQLGRIFAHRRRVIADVFQDPDAPAGQPPVPTPG
jgi:ligand-binding SRPBCC domain-containing protein